MRVSKHRVRLRFASAPRNDDLKLDTFAPIPPTQAKLESLQQAWQELQIGGTNARPPFAPCVTSSKACLRVSRSSQPKRPGAHASAIATTFLRRRSG